MMTNIVIRVCFGAWVGLVLTVLRMPRACARRTTMHLLKFHAIYEIRFSMYDILYCTYVYV